MGTKEWEELVPHSVSTQIKRLGLWGYGLPISTNGVNGPSFIANGSARAVEKTGAVSSGQ